MKVLSLLQPFATLIAIEAKRFETRSWRTSHKGAFAIHASRGIQCLSLVRAEPFASALAAAGIHSAGDLPMGAIVAVGQLAGCWPTSEIVYDGKREVNRAWQQKISDQELAFGDWRTGRYAWRIERVAPVFPVVKVSGQMGLWTATPDIAAEVWERVRLVMQVCRVCGCTDSDCRQCVERTGEPCHWVEPDLCSACAKEPVHES